MEPDKILKYLMNPEHPEGYAKARFFFALGFKSEDWQALADALVSSVLDATVVQTVDTSHGSKYIVDGLLRAPNGRSALVRTVWIREPRHGRLRLATAYPREE